MSQVPPGELTAAEQSLVTAVSRGQRLNLAGAQAGVPDDETRARGDFPVCRAYVIRDILRGRLAPEPDPRGLRLQGARIIGRLDLEDVTTDVNLELTDCLLEEGILARDARLGAVILDGCEIGHFADYPSLDGTQFACSVLVLRRAQVIGRSHNGAVRLSGATIGGRLDCTGATLRNDAGPALVADSLVVERGIVLDDVRADGSDAHGAVLLAGAQIGGGLYCTDAILHNDSGPALNADRVAVAEGMLLRGLSAVGARGGAVRLSDAQIGGQLDCRGADLRNGSGPALYADSLRVVKALILADGFRAVGGGESVAIDLTGAQVGGALVFGPEGLEHEADPHRRLAVDGLQYAGAPERISPDDWMRLLREGTPRYAAQPYQQLATGFLAVGDDRQARRILMAQRDDQLARTPRSWAERSLGQISKITLGYGYQPVRLVWWLSAVVALSCVLAVALGAHGALAQTDMTATPGRPCTVIQELSVGMDLNLPFGASLAREDCDLPKSPSAAANWLTSTGLALRIVAWAFAALFAAAIAGAIRKT